MNTCGHSYSHNQVWSTFLTLHSPGKQNTSHRNEKQFLSVRLIKDSFGEITMRCSHGFQVGASGKWCVMYCGAILLTRKCTPFSQSLLQYTTNDNAHTTGVDPLSKWYKVSQESQCWGAYLMPRL